MAVIVALTILGLLLGLLLSLGIGRSAFRRMLLPRINVKLPPSGARPWSRTRVPNPASLGGNGNAESTQVTMNALDSAFNPRYSLPDDPFTSSQGGVPGWPESLG